MTIRGKLRETRGFTLIETIVALAILTGLFAAMYRIYEGGWRGARIAASYETALDIARSSLAAAGVTTPLAEAQASGASGPFAWTVAVAPQGSADTLAGAKDETRLYWVTATVRWTAPGAATARTITLTTLKREQAR